MLSASIVIVARLLHLSKAESPMLAKPLPKVREVKPLQPAKAELPMLVIFLEFFGAI